MRATLELRHDPQASHEATAWFFCGPDPGRWLEELARCGLAESGTRLLVIGKTAVDFQPAGVLVIPEPGKSPTVPPAACACRSLGGKFYFPVDAALYPPLGEAELMRLCSWAIAFFHPALGLTTADEQDLVRVWDLLDPPAERTANWNLARHGLPVLPRLNAIALAGAPTMEELFGDANQEIATEPIADLPLAPDEPGDHTLARSRRTLQRLIARALAQAIRRAPRAGSRRTWINQVEDWANRQLGRAAEEIARLRNKELHRLLSLLDQNPEAGLRHAIPLNNFGHRGVAPPAARLGEHELKFDPRRLGGRPADFWSVPADLQEQLRHRYREMADREMQLGRFRRAAYIYAELLGDLTSAAHAFKQGRLFREAALLYAEHLQSPVQAARCLAEGGFFREAIAIYETLPDWLEAASLWERLGDHEAAVEAIRKVMAECIESGDLLRAARLAEERLQLPDEAIELLQRAWPASRQAAVALGALFALLARLGRHDDALARANEIGRTPLPDSLAAPLLRELTLPARNYPDARVRHQIADRSRVLIAQQLGRTGLPDEEASRLMECLVRLAPEDRLLARDANRHLAARRNATLAARRSAPAAESGRKPVLLRKLELPRQIEWLQLRTESRWFFALGVTGRHLTVLRGTWEGAFQSLSWECQPSALLRGSLLFEPTAQRGKSLALSFPSETEVLLKTFPVSDASFDCECVVGPPAWGLGRHVPATINEEAAWTVFPSQTQVVLACLDKQSRLLRTIDITKMLGQAHSSIHSLQLCALDQGVVVAHGSCLLDVETDSKQIQIMLPCNAGSLCPTRPHTRQGVAVMLEHGAMLYWRGATGPNLIELDDDLKSPLAAFIPGGPLALISGAEGRLLEVDSRGVHSVTRFEVSVPHPVGLRPTSHSGQFAVLGSNGELAIYQCSG